MDIIQSYVLCRDWAQKCFTGDIPPGMRYGNPIFEMMGYLDHVMECELLEAMMLEAMLGLS